MKNSRMRLCAVLFLAAVTATGCGDKAIALTDTEQNVIVSYAAHIVSKYNTKQPDGLAYVEISTEELGEKAQETGQAAEEGAGQEPSSETTEDGQEPTVQQTTLSDALGLSGVDAAVTAIELKDSYVEQDYYALDASAGKTYLVVNVSLTNTTAQDVNCDLLSQTPVFQASVNGMDVIPAETTILLNDLSTYQGTIPAGGSVATVLLFQVQKDSVTQVDTLTLRVKMNGTSTDIICK